MHQSSDSRSAEAVRLHWTQWIEPIPRPVQMHHGCVQRMAPWSDITCLPLHKHKDKLVHLIVRCSTTQGTRRHALLGCLMPTDVVFGRWRRVWRLPVCH